MKSGAEFGADRSPGRCAPGDDGPGCVLDRSRGPTDMDLPGFRLHPLKGALKGHWAVSVSGNWRVTFRFDGGHAIDVDYIDYH